MLPGYSKSELSIRLYTKKKKSACGPDRHNVNGRLPLVTKDVMVAGNIYGYIPLYLHVVEARSRCSLSSHHR